ncbi:MAG: hypothetical protein B6U69_00615 [Thermofilum sp. ex4484_15]|nr:MAG: hypothetical protein B6U69_00615 [Thermofilum sp. ex4484_15]
MEIKEKGIIVKDVRKVKLKVCICYPNEYKIGLSNLALHIIYYALNNIDWVSCERFFYGFKPPVTLENHLPLRKLDAILFTLQYELDLPYVLRILIDAGIPLYSSERGREDPIIIGGGPLVMQNPLPFEDFFDVLFIGEIEEVANDLMEALLEAKKRERDLTYFLNVKGIYLPSLEMNKVERVYVNNLDKIFYPYNQIISLKEKTVFDNSFLLEIGRGCGWGCRFCMAGYAYRPPRFRSLNKIEEILESGRIREKYGKVTLISFAAADHPKFKEILNLLRDKGFKYSVPSLRVDKVDVELIDLLKEGGLKTLTVAPEVASEELSKRINKGIEPEDVVNLALEAFNRGFKNLKLYFMIGLPQEGDEDVIAIARLLERVLKIGFSSVRVTITPFTPKPHTPLQWVGQEPLEVLRRKIKLLIKHVKHKERIWLRIYDPKKARIEALIAKGDNRLSKPLVRVALRGEYSVASWHKALGDCSINLIEVVNKPLPQDSELPWDKVDIGVTKAYLLAEYRKYLNGITTPSCYDKCTYCGVCRAESR